MSIHYKVSGVWKEITDPQTKVSSVWKEITEGWVRVSGVWKQFFSRGGLPEDLIAFSTDSTDIDGWLKMDGAEASPTLIGKYPKVHASQGGIGGTVDHTHSAFSGSTDAPSISFVGALFPFDLPSPHSHTMNHTHASNINNEPEYLKVLPVTDGDAIKTSMFLFYDGVSAPSGWSELAGAIDKMFKGDLAPESSPTGGNASHSHTHSGSSGATNPPDPSNDIAPGSGRFMLAPMPNHSHTINHTHSGGNNYPEWHGLIPVKPDSDTFELPSGICAFFKGSVVPDGWSYYSALEGKWIQGKSTAGATGGANSHNHVLSGIDSGVYGPNASPFGIGSGLKMYMQSTAGHYHSIDHIESTEDNIPPYQELMLLKKY